MRATGALLGGGVTVCFYRGQHARRYYLGLYAIPFQERVPKFIGIVDEPRDGV
jgi:hypothetical protein